MKALFVNQELGSLMMLTLEKENTDCGPSPLAASRKTKPSYSSTLCGMGPAELVGLAEVGDGAAIDEIVRRYRPGLVASVQRQGLPYEAEDIAQDALVVLLQRLSEGSLGCPDRLVGFLFGVARNLCISFKRKLARRQTDLVGTDVELYASSVGNPLDAYETSLMRRQIDAGIAALSKKRDQEIIRQLYLAEEERRLIERQLSLSQPQMSRCLYRAKRRLGQSLAAMKEI